jgi:hypothetical protein
MAWRNAFRFAARTRFGVGHFTNSFEQKVIFNLRSDLYWRWLAVCSNSNLECVAACALSKVADMPAHSKTQNGRALLKEPGRC